jgi:high-affinity nickel-transport protein
MSWLSQGFLAYLLGVKHGMDPDHLATIDSFVRANALSRPRLARFTGVLFSLGHGGAVILMANAAYLFSSQWHIPDWLGHFGALFSITCLFILGALNLHQALHSRAGPTGVAPIGFKSALLPRWGAVNAWTIMGVGLLFAISFDTMSQALLFSVVLNGQSQAWMPLCLGVFFLLGMMTTDALVSLWSAWLIGRADRVAWRASQWMSVVVALSSIFVALLGVYQWIQPNALGENHLIIGVGLILFTGLGYLIGVKASGRNMIDG